MTAFEDESDLAPLEVSPIKRLHLHYVDFPEPSNIESFIMQLAQGVEHLVLTSFPVMEDGPVLALHFCEMMGNRLLSLKIDCYCLATGRGWPIEVEIFFAWLPVLENLELDGRKYIHWQTRSSNWQELFVDFPSTIKRCTIGRITWDHARLFIERLRDPTYLPNLSSSLALELQPKEQSRHHQKLTDYKESLSKLGLSGHKRSVSFELQWTFEADKKAFTLY